MSQGQKLLFRGNENLLSHPDRVDMSFEHDALVKLPSLIVVLGVESFELSRVDFLSHEPSRFSESSRFP